VQNNEFITLNFHRTLVIYSHISKHAVDTSYSLYCLNVYHKEGFITYSIEQSPSETNRFSASQEIPTFVGTPRFTTFTSARHLSLS